MARKVSSPEERLDRIFQIRDYVLKQIDDGEKFSTRSVAGYFTENCFSISNNTVDVYLNLLYELDSKNFEKIKPYIDKNKPETVDSPKVKLRVLNATKLLLSNLTVEQIALNLNSTPAIIYRDLTVRLPQVEKNEQILTKVSDILKEHQLENIKPEKRLKTLNSI